MEEITLSFDLSSKRLGYEETGELRREISIRIDKVLKDSGTGKWSGGTSKLNSMEIFIRASEPDAATDIIRSALADHWVLPLMEIRRQSRHNRVRSS